MFKRKLQPGAKPWQAKWNHGKIASTALNDMWKYWAAAILATIVSIPILVYLPQEIKKGNYLASISIIFIAAAIGFIFAALRSTLHWRKFGQVILVMDPFPGSLGGDVGGFIDLPHDRRSCRFDVTLSCIRVIEQFESDTERIVWQEQGIAVSESGQYVTRLKFRFSVPANLPHTDDIHYWKVNVRSKLHGIDFDRNFIIPVYNTVDTKLSQLNVSPEPPSLIPGRIVKGRQTPNGLFLYYPAGRNLKDVIMLLSFGCICACVIGYGFIQNMPLFYPIFPSVYGVLNFIGFSVFSLTIFGMLSIIPMVYGLYLLGATLKVEIWDGQLKTLRSIFGVSVISRKIPLTSIASIEKEITGEGRWGRKITVFYTVKVRTVEGESITVGDMIEGPKIAGQLMEVIRRACKPVDPSVQDSKPV